MTMNKKTIPESKSRSGRRDFLALSLLSGTTLLLSGESYGQPSPADNSDVEIVKEVTTADTLLLYTNLLDEVRRLVLRSDAEKIFSSKVLATNWLNRLIPEAERLRGRFPQSTSIRTEADKQAIHSLIFQAMEGREAREALVFMRQGPLEEIKRLDREFDGIRMLLVAAGEAIKRANEQNLASEAKRRTLTDARRNISSAVQELNRYNSPETERLSEELAREFGTRLITPARLQRLLEVVDASLDNTGPSNAAGRNNHGVLFEPVGYAVPVVVNPAFQRGITNIIKARLNPASWLQVAIGYSVSFPILMRVSNRENRRKLLNDALRLVPPGLRDPKLRELAEDLAQV